MYQFIVRNGIPVTVCILILAIVGILAALKIPVQMIPDLDVRTISIKTSWPGATPQDIEKEILVEQEEYLRNTPYLKELRSKAQFGKAIIELEFPFGVDITNAQIQVNNALSQVPSYPNNVDEPVVSTSSYSASSFMFLRVSPREGNPRHLDMDMMRDYVEDNVKTRLSGLPGVSLVQVAGGAERQIQIRVDQARLSEYQLSLVDVRDAVRGRNRDYSAGKLESGKRRYLIRTIGRFSDVEELSGLILKRDGNGLVRLQDVATVLLDHEVIQEKAYINGLPVLLLSIKRESGSNVIDIKNAILKEVELINEDFLLSAGMRLSLTSDDVAYVEDSIFNVWKNLVLGTLLATLVMYLFIRSFRVTAVGVVGIPVCVIAAFLGLMLAGRSINVISLAGIAFSVGMTLDNCIVVLESILIQRRKGLSKFDASVEGVRNVGMSVFASTMTTVLVFLPIIFIVEEAGQLYSDIAISISAAIVASMFVALTLVPVACANIDLPINAIQNDSKRIRAQRFFRWVEWLSDSHTRRLASVAVTVLVAGLIALLLTPNAEYLPEGEEPKTFAVLNAPAGYNLATMERIGEEINEYLTPFIDSDPNDFESGKSPVPAIRYVNMRISPEKLKVVAESIDPSQIDDLMGALLSKFKTYTGMRAFASKGSIISSNNGGTRSINLDISGPELEDLFEVAQAVYVRSREIFDEPRVRSDPSSLLLTQPMLEVMPHWDRAAELGISAEHIGFTVAVFTEGAFVSKSYLNDEKVDIYLFNKQGPGKSVETLGDITVQSTEGVVVPLSELANYTEVVDTSSIRRVNGQRTVTVNIIPPSNVALEKGVEIVREELVQYLKVNNRIPGTVNVSISGAADQLDATKQALSVNYVVATLIVFLLMVAIFSHWWYPMIIMLTIPLGVAGGIAGLAIYNGIGTFVGFLGFSEFNQAFDMITMLGFLILMGTVVNNPILILDQSIKACVGSGVCPKKAVLEAVASRYRPIAISTITTIVGISPLVFMPGAGSELYRGVGVIVMSGIIGAALVTLFILPPLTISFLGWLNRNPELGQQGPVIIDKLE